jgi:putative FmdB family regulatory protein
MPIYEYLCGDCGRRFEALVRIGKEGDVRCEACLGPNVRKLLSSFGIGGGGGRLKESSGGCSTCHGHSCATCK